MRYLVAAAVALVATLMLFGVFRNHALRSDDAEVPADELLAYDLSVGAGVVLELQQQTNEFRLTTWCTVDKAEPDDRFVYTVDVDWRDQLGKLLGSSQLAFETRVSFPTPDRSPSSFTARLAYSNALVTDSRTARVLVPEFAQHRPAQIRLSPHPESLRRVLVRATFPEQRRELEVAAVDQRLSPAERLELVRDRTSVGYDDLPYSLRIAALGTWQRRLDASGIEGQDYHVQRLLVGSGRTNTGLSSAQRRPWLIHRGHALAVNLRSKVSLKVATTPNTTLLVADGIDREQRTLAIREDGEVELLAGDAAVAQTIVFSTASESPTPIGVTISPTDLDSVLGPKRLVEGSERSTVEPMLRRIAYYQLDPASPILVKVAPDQKFLGLTIRGCAGALLGSIEADIDNTRSKIEIHLTPSLFEQWSDGSVATDPQQLFLRIPPGAKLIALRGTAQLRLALFTSDPAVVADRLSTEYDVPIAPGQRWQFPKFDVSRMVPILPENSLDISSTQRAFDLLAQSRLVGSDRVQDEPEEMLQPAMETVRRHIIEPVRWGPEIPLPEDVVVSLDHPHRGYIPSKGPRSGRARVAYRLGAGSVGATLELVVDGTVVHREETLVSSGQFDTIVSAGVHRFELNAAGGESETLLEATPLEAAGALRRRAVHRILPGRVLRFQVNKQVDAANIIISTYSQGERLVALRYALAAQQRQDFLHSVTPLRGEISGVATELPGAWYWESGPSTKLRRHRGSIALGNDVSNGEMAVILRNQSRSTVFVALVLVGQLNSKQSSAQRFWTTEEP